MTLELDWAAGPSLAYGVLAWQSNDIALHTCAHAVRLYVFRSLPVDLSIHIYFARRCLALDVQE